MMPAGGMFMKSEVVPRLSAPRLSVSSFIRAYKSSMGYGEIPWKLEMFDVKTLPERQLTMERALTYLLVLR